MNSFSIKGSVEIYVIDRGNIIARYNYDNLITDIGLNTMLKMIGGDSAGINKLGLGSNPTAAKNTDTQLYGKLILADVKKDYSFNNRIRFLTTIPENTFGTTVNYREIGLFCKTLTEETLITRAVFNDIVYQKPGNSLSLSYSLQIVRS